MNYHPKNIRPFEAKTGTLSSIKVDTATRSLILRRFIFLKRELLFSEICFYYIVNNQIHLATLNNGFVKLIKEGENKSLECWLIEHVDYRDYLKTENTAEKLEVFEEIDGLVAGLGEERSSMNLKISKSALGYAIEFENFRPPEALSARLLNNRSYNMEFVDRLKNIGCPFYSDGETHHNLDLKIGCIPYTFESRVKVSRSNALKIEPCLERLEIKIYPT